MKYIFFTLLICLTTNTFADEIQPPAPCEPDGIIGGHEYIDLGLPSGTLWATYNVGATTPYEGGFLFAWGEVNPKEDFTWENYKFFIDYEYDPKTENGLCLRTLVIIFVELNMMRRGINGEMNGDFLIVRNYTN